LNPLKIFVDKITLDLFVLYKCEIAHFSEEIFYGSCLSLSRSDCDLEGRGRCILYFSLVESVDYIKLMYDLSSPL